MRTAAIAAAVGNDPLFRTREPGVAEQILRAGERIVSYEVCDWITPLPADTLLARGMMGDGHIDFASFTRAVARAG